MAKSFRKRGRFKIIYEILSISQTPTPKTHILYRCNLSHDQLQKYLKYLTNNGLLRTVQEKNREYYQITERGKEFLQRYDYLKQLLEANPNRPLPPEL